MTIPAWLMVDKATLNLVLNALTTLLGVGGVAAYLRYRVNYRRVHNEDEANIRDHYAAEVQALREANMRLERHFREMLDDVDKRYAEARDTWEKRWRESADLHEDCIRERSELRNEIDGLKNQLKLYSADQLLVLERQADQRPPSMRAPDAMKTPARVKKIVRDNGHH